MIADGYGVRVEFDGTTLVAEGTTGPSRVALRGERHGDGPVRVDVDALDRVEFKGATALVNGRLTLRVADGARYVLHFRRKQRDAFAELWGLLVEATPSAEHVES